jgi:hypothetical protein
MHASSEEWWVENGEGEECVKKDRAIHTHTHVYGCIIVIKLKSERLFLV